MNKIFFSLFFVMLFLLGCSQKQDFIYIKEPQKFHFLKKCKKTVSLKEIQFPYYLEDGKIPYLKDGKINFFDEYYATDSEEFITKRAVKILSRIFHDVKIYPWNDGDLILKIQIDELIAKKNKVFLQGFWILRDKNNKILQKYIYKKQMLIKKLDVKEVVLAMQVLFDQFINDISRKICGI